MIEVGRIIELSEGKAKVSLPRKVGCAGCGRCAFAVGGGRMVLEAENDAGARLGDEVEVNVPSRDPLQASLSVFGLPLAALLVGVIGGYRIFQSFGADPNFGALLIGAALLLAVFFWVRSRENKRSAKGERVAVIRVIRCKK